MNCSDALTIEQRLCDLISAETSIAVTLDTKLEDLGIDSLEFVDLLLTIGNEIKEVPQGGDFQTVRDILTAIQ